MLGSNFLKMDNRKKISLKYKAVESDQGFRVDQIAAKQFQEYSRAHIQRWIKEGNLLVNNQKIKAKQALITDDFISVDFWEEPLLADKPEEITLDLLHEDSDILVINKPSGLVVHPGSGNPSGTLVNALLAYDEKLSFLPRAGIVHRLDKDTSGIMVIAKTETAYLNLVDQLKKRSVKRTYLAVVVGVPISSKVIDEPIGRHPKIRTKQAVSKNGKEAITRIHLKESYDLYSLLKVNLETGRTHQIRVHLAHIGYPIVGDPVYGGRKKFASGSSKNIMKVISEFKRQALHAYELELIHPSSKLDLSFRAPIPNDFEDLIEKLQK